jgi:uncharacterized membrane protein YoaK (UPF0700 family)
MLLGALVGGLLVLKVDTAAPLGLAALILAVILGVATRARVKDGIESRAA